MGELLADDPGFWSIFGALFILGLGAAGAWAAGKAVAGTWRPVTSLPFGLVALAAAVRFLRYAIFGEDLTSAPRFIAALVVVVLAGAYGYRSHRAKQMVGQYPWLFARAGPLGWGAKPSD